MSNFFYEFLKNKLNPKTEREGIFINEYLIVGENYGCQKNKGRKRKDVISKSKVGDYVTLEPFVYENKIAYAVVSDKIKLDLGTMSAGAAARLAAVEGAKYVGVLSGRYKNTFKVKVYRK